MKSTEIQAEIERLRAYMERHQHDGTNLAPYTLQIGALQKQLISGEKSKLSSGLDRSDIKAAKDQLNLDRERIASLCRSYTGKKLTETPLKKFTVKPPVIPLKVIHHILFENLAKSGLALDQQLEVAKCIATLDNYTVLVPNECYWWIPLPYSCALSGNGKQAGMPNTTMLPYESVRGTGVSNPCFELNLYKVHKLSWRNKLSGLMNAADLKALLNEKELLDFNVDSPTATSYSTSMETELDILKKYRKASLRGESDQAVELDAYKALGSLLKSGSSEAEEGLRLWGEAVRAVSL